MLWSLVVIVASVSQLTRGQTVEEMRKIKELTEKDIISFSPESESNITRVDINIEILDVQYVNLRDRTMKVQLILRKSWKDDRLSHQGKTPITIPHTKFYSIWEPDIIIANAESNSRQRTPYREAFSKLHDDGTLLISKRETVVLLCRDMDLAQFPFDHHVCNIRIETYHDSDNLKLFWSHKEQIQIADNIYVPGLDINTKAYQTSHCKATYRKEKYKCLNVDLYFKRKFWNHGMYMLEGITVISVSWFVFWFTKASIVCRFLYLMFCFVLQCMFIYRSTRSRPPVAYQTSLDTWNTICFVTIMLEFIFMLRVGHSTPNKKYVISVPKQKRSTNQRILSFFHFGNLTAAIVIPILFYLAVIIFFTLNISSAPHHAEIPELEKDPDYR